MSIEEYNWRLDYIREIARRRSQQGNPYNFRLSRVEFPKYEEGPN
jgi:hypothetical protein